MKITIDLNETDAISLKRVNEQVTIELVQYGAVVTEIFTNRAAVAEVHTALGMLGIVKSEVNQPKGGRG